MHIDLSTLNPEQRDAVITTQGPLMILAGAGTGKTRVITYRIGHMLQIGIPAGCIVALTFTNKAAREMRERVQALAGQAAKKIFVGTFHSFCLLILRQHFAAAGLEKRFSLIDTSDQIDLIRKALEEKHWQGLYRPEVLLARISNAKNALLEADDLLSGRLGTFQDEDPVLLGQVYALYERQLKLNRCIDFDDCILRVYKMLASNPSIGDMLRSQYRYFLVDEFQDTNFAQLSVIHLLASPLNNICAVGDDDQSIYSWRGALVETIDRFEEMFPGTRLVKLEQNYRCSNVILDAANTVIKNNTGRKGKTLWSRSDIQHPIVKATLGDDREEAQWIARKCFSLLGQGHKLRDIGILYRANNQAKAIEIALRELNLKYKVFGGTSFFEKKEVKDFLSFLKLIAHRNDRMSFWRIINIPNRGVGLKTLEKIEESCKQRDQSPFRVCADGSVDLPDKTKASIAEFVGTIEELAAMPAATREEIETLGQQVIARFHLDDEIRSKTSHEGTRQKKLESLRRLPGWVAQTVEYLDAEKSKGNLLDEVIDLLTLGDDPKHQKDQQDDNHISLMTIHGSKGLEFPLVFVCGLEEEQLPHKNSLENSQGLAEERRLFYVAITRAKERLFLSLAKERFSGFQKQPRKASRFLKELPDENLQMETSHSSTPSRSEEEKKTTNIKRLGDLKTRLQQGFNSPR